MGLERRNLRYRVIIIPASHRHVHVSALAIHRPLRAKQRGGCGLRRWQLSAFQMKWGIRGLSV